MTSKDRRARHRRAVQTQVIDAARKLFVSEGYDAVTMRRVASLIDFSTTAIYQHFKDKDALIREICRIDLASLADALNAIAATPDPLLRLREIGMAYVAFGKNHPHQYWVLFISGHKNSPEELAELGHGDPQSDAYVLLVNTVQEAIGTKRLKANLSDADLIAQSFWASIHGAIALQTSYEGDAWVEWRSLEDISALIIDAFLQGITK